MLDRELTNQNVVTDTDVTISPSTAILLEDFFERLLVGMSLVDLGPLGTTVVLGQLLFYLAGDHEGKVHVGSLLELSTAQESVLAVLRSGNPTDAVVGIKLNAGLALFVGNELHTIVIHEDVG